MQRVQQLLDGLKASLGYEKKEYTDVKGYFTKMNVILNPSTPYQPCGHCASLMKRYHSDFQRGLWTALTEEAPEYVPELPEFKTIGLNNAYQQKNLKLVSLADLVAMENNLRNQATRYRRKKNAIDAQRCIDDQEALRSYRLTKYNYFEEFLPNLLTKLEEESKAKEVIEEQEVQTETRERSIDKDELIAMKNAGKTHKECAKHFGVTSGAISQSLKKLNYVKPKKKASK